MDTPGFVELARAFVVKDKKEIFSKGFNILNPNWTGHRDNLFPQGLSFARPLESTGNRDYVEKYARLMCQRLVLLGKGDVTPYIGIIKLEPECLSWLKLSWVTQEAISRFNPLVGIARSGPIREWNQIFDFENFVIDPMFVTPDCIKRLNGEVGTLNISNGKFEYTPYQDFVNFNRSSVWDLGGFISRFRR